MRKRALHLYIIVVIFSCCNGKVFADTTTIPELYQPLLLDEFPQVRDFALSPKGDEIYFSVTSYRNELSFILFIAKTNAGWSAPKVAEFSGSYNDIEPAFSPDGNKLYFSSKRPNTLDDSEPKDYDIWFVERDDGKGNWSKPVNLGPAVNTPENEFYPSITEMGDLYFTSKRDDVKGGEDIYVCRYENGSYAEAVNLGDSINSKRFEFNAYIAPDESFLLFSSFGREDGVGGGDLYISLQKPDGTWSKAKNLGTGINSIAMDYCPFVDSKTKKLYFTSRRNNFPEYFKKPLNARELENILKQAQNGLDKIYIVDFNAVIDLPAK